MVKLNDVEGRIYNYNVVGRSVQSTIGSNMNSLCRSSSSWLQVRGCPLAGSGMLQSFLEAWPNVCVVVGIFLVNAVCACRSCHFCCNAIRTSLACRALRQMLSSCPRARKHVPKDARMASLFQSGNEQKSAKRRMRAAVAIIWTAL